MNQTSLDLTQQPDAAGHPQPDQARPPSKARAASSGVISAAAELQRSVADLKATNAEVARTLRDRDAA